MAAMSGTPTLPMQFTGELLRPGDAGYDASRRIHNGMIDRRPGLIARCRSAADVAAAVALARDEGLELSVRGGGHNVAGRSVTEGGVMIDLSAMREVVVDAPARRARVQGGATWGDVDRATQRHGLAVTGGMISTTGVGGLTLGGGLGWLMGAYGLTVDSLVSAEVVTADGRVLTASEAEHPDLFWALRGGGGNFGVVTAFDFRLHTVGPIVGGFQIAYPFSEAEALLRFYRELTADIPDELTVNAALAHAPDGSGAPVAVLTGCHVGTRDRAERELEPIFRFGSPLLARTAPLEYVTMNSLLDDAYPPGALNYWKSSFLDGLSDEAIAAIVGRFATCPSPSSAFVFENVHGEAARVPVEATAVPFREPGYNLLMTSVWDDPAANERNIEWTREAFDELQPFFARNVYVNYLADDEAGDGRIRAAYGPHYDRLVEVKTTYDPENLFRLNQNIPPRGARPPAPA
jgi:FAD/FMN-containing dehydrogenase